MRNACCPEPHLAQSANAAESAADVADASVAVAQPAIVVAQPVDRAAEVATGRPLPPDPDEPARVAYAAARMRLRYVVLTAVARDDLDDGGASQFAATVGAVRARGPEAQVEVLTPDFKGDRSALEAVLSARPDVFNHNVEMAPRLFPSLRPQGEYARSLRLLRHARTLRPSQVTKSGLMLGLGETDAEVRHVLADLRGAQVGIVTLGQYLRPTRDHAPVARYVPPADFERWAGEARALGFASVYSGVFVRSSFNAEEVFHGALGAPAAAGPVSP